MATSKTKITPIKKIENTPVVITTKEFKYLHKNINISPRKLRLVAQTLRGQNPTKVLIDLKFTNNKSARAIIPALKNIISTAKHNYQLSDTTLKIVAIQVDEGLKIKRMDKSHGSRFNRGIIQKRHSRLTIKVTGRTL